MNDTVLLQFPSQLSLPADLTEQIPINNKRLMLPNFIKHLLNVTKRLIIAYEKGL
jgi:hypothetical protein